MRGLRLNIQTKLFLLLAGLTSVTLLSVSLIIGYSTAEKVEEDILDDFEQLQTFFKTQQSLRYDRLLESAYLIAENSNFKGSFQTGDLETIYYSVLEFSEFTRSDLIVVTDNEGEVLAWFGEREKTGSDLSAYNGIEEALNYEAPLESPEWPLLWNIENEVFQVASVPIYLGFNEIVGTLTLGSLLRHYEARELAEGTSFQIAFISGEELIGASHDDMHIDHYEETLENHGHLFDSLTSSLQISSPIKTKIEDDLHLAFISPLGMGDESVYVASVLLEQEFETIDFIRNNILIITMASVLLMIPVAIFLGNKFTKPITLLSSSMTAVEKGDLNVQVNVKTGDEIEGLANSFNSMIVGLKERFALTRYVGSHTLKMIQDTVDADADLGGSYQEMAMIFSDIRGSTSKISVSEPAEFVEKLNQTLGFQTDIIKKHGGAVDKYVGDEVVAVFTGENALKSAIQASIEIQKHFRHNHEINTFFRGLGIGVNFGEVILGNMGTRDRMDYTVIGSEVNLCARLCSAAEDGEVLVTRHCLQNHNLEHRFEHADLRELSLKGFKEPVSVISIAIE
jgi:class 3 adenylate cyclase